MVMAHLSRYGGDFELLGDSVSILSWDYRGQYGSTLNRERNAFHRATLR